MYSAKAMRMNGVEKGQSNKDSIQHDVTVGLYELKNSFSTKSYESQFQPQIYMKKE